MSGAFGGAQGPPPQPPQHQVDLGKIFTDVSRTVSGIRNFLGRPDGAGAAASSTLTSTATNAQSPLAVGAAAAGGPSLETPLADAARIMSNSASSFASGSPLAGLLGGSDTCFQACGMEEIARAANRAGELFITMRLCAIVITILAALAVFLLMVVVVWLLYKQYGVHWTLPHDTRLVADNPSNGHGQTNNKHYNNTPIGSLFQRRGEPKNATPPLPSH